MALQLILMQEKFFLISFKRHRISIVLQRCKTCAKEAEPCLNTFFLTILYMTGTGTVLAPRD